MSEFLFHKHCFSSKQYFIATTIILFYIMSYIKTFPGYNIRYNYLNRKLKCIIQNTVYFIPTIKYLYNVIFLFQNYLILKINKLFVTLYHFRKLVLKNQISEMKYICTFVSYYTNYSTIQLLNIKIYC